MSHGQTEQKYSGVTRMGNALYSGVTYCCKTLVDFQARINDFVREQNTDAIQNVYIVPAIFVDTQFWNTRITGQDVVTFSKELTKPSTLDYYKPVNNKLLTFPYCFLTVSNNRGQSNNYRFEDFLEIDEFPNQAIFNISGLPVVGGQSKCTPNNYKLKTEDDNEDEGILGGTFPILNWSVDNYNTWLRGNVINTATGITSDIVQSLVGASLIAGSIGTGNLSIGVSGTAMLANSLTDITRQVGQVNSQALVPNSMRGNTLNGDIITADNKNQFYFYYKTIKKEYAQIIDKYFSMFGYKVNKIKVFHIDTRENWNYIKTIGANIEAVEGKSIPQSDLQKIKDIFNNGITFWHSPDVFLNYALPNPIRNRSRANEKTNI